MQEASFGVFKTIVYMIGFYYLIKFLAKIFLPIIMKSMIHKVQSNLNDEQFNASFDNKSVNINQNNNKENPKSTKKVGDYIDYEEID